MATELRQDDRLEEEMTDQDRAILAALSSLFNPPDADELGTEAWNSLRNWLHHGQPAQLDREMLAALVGVYAYARLSNTLNGTFRHLFDFGPAPTRRVAMMWKDAFERGRQDRQSA